MSNEIPEVLQSLEHFLAINEVDKEVFQGLIDFSICRKAEFKRGELKPVLQNKVLAMVFQKSSLRTRLGFETAMVQLGGHAANLESHQIGMKQREEVGDIARVISSMCDGIMARVHTHQVLIEMAKFSSIPIINGLSDWAHPCQALSDIMTIQEHFGKLAGLKVAYIGDANNVARSLLNACIKTDMPFAIASPEGYQLDTAQVESARAGASGAEASITVTDKPAEAVADADVVYTDVWTSMGQEDESQKREKDFIGYQINADLMKKAKPTAVVMHCLPAHRNMEITSEVMEGPQSIIFPQAENRLHSQRALLEVLLTNPR